MRNCRAVGGDRTVGIVLPDSVDAMRVRGGPIGGGGHTALARRLARRSIRYGTGGLGNTLVHNLDGYAPSVRIVGLDQRRFNLEVASILEHARHLGLVHVGGQCVLVSELLRLVARFLSGLLVLARHDEQIVLGGHADVLGLVAVHLDKQFVGVATEAEWRDSTGKGPSQRDLVNKHILAFAEKIFKLFG